MQDIYYPEIDQTSLIMKATFYGIALAPRKYHPYTFLKINDVIKESQYSKKNKVYFVDTLSRRTSLRIQQSHVDQKKVTMLYN